MYFHKENLMTTARIKALLRNAEQFSLLLCSVSQRSHCSARVLQRKRHAAADSLQLALH